MSSTKHTKYFIFLVVLLLLTACAPANPPGVAPMPGLTPPAMMVYITDETCPSMEINSGVTVGWRNTGKEVHILRSRIQGDGQRLFDSGTLEPGDGFTMTFIEPGIISYDCSEDGSLKGTITVTDLVAQPEPVQPAVGSGVAHSCLLTQQGEAFCWGQGSHQNQEISPDTFGKPFQVEGLEAISLGAGWYHACVATRDGKVKCWGQNTYGQLGIGTTQDSVPPVEVTGLEAVTAVTSGATHSCALSASGDVYCWGQNSQNQLGDGTMTDQDKPVQVSDLSSPAASITAGPPYTCAILVDGRVECWGQFTFFADEVDQQIHASPISIPNLDRNDIEKIAAGDNHLCILTKSREVLCEGIFFPPSDQKFNKPVDSLGKLQGHVLDIFAGTDFTCVLADTGKVYCWGDNYFDQLGDGTFIGSMEPKEVSRAGDDVIALGGGHYTACALAADGKVTCWGDTSFGQIGDGTARWK